MKLRITESQLKNVKLITEGENAVDSFMSKSVEVSDTLNKLYNKLTFSTISEVISGEIDLDSIDNKLQQLNTVLYTYYKRGENYFNEIPEVEYDNNPKLGDLQMKMEDIYQSVSYDKLDALEDLVSNLKDILEKDINSKFSDIKNIEI